MIGIYCFRTARRVLAALTAAALSCAAVAGIAGTPVSFSGPSTMHRSTPAVFTAAGLAPNMAVSVSIVDPTDIEAHHGAVADASGTVTFRFVAARAGLHRLKIIDSSGSTLASVVVAAVE